MEASPFPPVAFTTDLVGSRLYQSLSRCCHLWHSCFRWAISSCSLCCFLTYFFAAGFLASFRASCCPGWVAGFPPFFTNSVQSPGLFAGFGTCPSFWNFLSSAWLRIWLCPLPRAHIRKVPSYATGPAEGTSAFNNNINVTASTSQNIRYLLKMLPDHSEHNFNITLLFTLGTSPTSPNFENKRPMWSSEIYRGIPCRITLDFSSTYALFEASVTSL